MIERLREWLLSLVTISILLSVTQVLIPKGTLQNVGSFAGGLLLLLALITPVFNVDVREVELDWESYQESIGRQQEQLAQAREKELEELIEAQTAAYISDKAAELGVHVSARVDTEIGDEGVPIPVGADLTGIRSDLLSDWVEAELGIPKERQVWHEGKN